MTTIKSDYSLDAKGLACPMPIVKTRKEIEKIEPGKVLLVEATDQGSKADIKAWSERSGHQYIGTIEEDGVLKHYIRKSSVAEKSEEVKYENRIGNDELKAKLTDGSIKLIDVREEAEFVFSHIPGAVSIPFGDLENRLDELNKDEEIYIICRTGNRSDLAAQLLKDKGFNHVYNVVPGMSGWDGALNNKQ
ncbi:sulfurtransferase TusA family protein [Bacillaceae bacterium W0354]